MTSVSHQPQHQHHQQHTQPHPESQLDPSTCFAEPETALATWSSNTTCTYNKQVLSIDCATLGFDGFDLFRDAHIALEHGHIYGLVAPNGSGKTSFARALSQLPVANHFRTECLSSDLDVGMLPGEKVEDHRNNEFVQDQNGISSVDAKQYCMRRVQDQINSIQQRIDSLEEALENTDIGSSGSSDDQSDNHESANTIESISMELGDLYDKMDALSIQSEERMDAMFHDLGFGAYAHTCYDKLSSGWKYKCQLISAMLTSPDIFIIDEPSFLDTHATRWLSSKLQNLAKSQNTIVILISHKQALMDELSDRILFLNPASKTLMSYSCSFFEFQKVHHEKTMHVHKSKENADKGHVQAKKSLDGLRKKLNKREKNLKATTSQNADQRFIKGKNKEAKQRADRSAAAKLKRMKKQVKEMEDEQEQWKQYKVLPMIFSPNHTRSDKTNNNNVGGKGKRDVMANDDGLSLTNVGGNNDVIIDLQEAFFQYEGSDDQVLNDVDIQISRMDRILLKAGNGQGKSTLAKIITGNLHPTRSSHERLLSGRASYVYFHQDALSHLVHRFGSMDAVLFLQHSSRAMNENADADAALMNGKSGEVSAADARHHLGRFGLTGSLVTRPIRTLSAGQRVRLWLSREFLIAPIPLLLVLDEVTENLDRETTDALIASIDGFEGAVLIISHDEYLCDEIRTTQIWQMQNGRLHRSC